MLRPTATLLSALVASGSFLFSTSSDAQTWTSYVAIEVPGVDSSLYEIQYDPRLFGDPASVTGADLLECVFGEAVPSGTYSDAFGGSFPYSVAGSAAEGVAYIDFSGSPFVEGFTIGGTTYSQDPSYNPSWAYYVAGGSGDNGIANGTPGEYGTADWVVANDGLSTRFASDGSFDAWVLTPSSPVTFDPVDTPQVAGVTPADFAGAALIQHLPPYWRPVGWVYLRDSYLFDPSTGGWHFLATAGTSWHVDPAVGAWNQLESYTAGTWLFFSSSASYFYDADEAAWHYYRHENAKWILDLTSSSWSLFDPPQAQ